MTGTWIEVHTSKRAYCVRGLARVTWMPGEKVISMVPVPAEDHR